MFIPDQYPDVLIREDGTESPCRFIPNRSSGIKKIKDGSEVDVRYTVAMPLDTPQLLIGDVVSGRYSNGEYLIYQDTIAFFRRGDLHCIAYI